MKKHLVNAKKFEHIYEYSSSRPIKFLVKKTFIPNKHGTSYLTQHTSQMSIQKLDKKNVLESLSETRINEKEKRRTENVHLMKLKSAPMLHQSLTMADLDYCYHISSMTSGLIWVNNINNLILTDKTGKTLYRFEDLYSEDGVHTVNTECELYYIDKNYNIKKLSQNMNTPTIFIETKDPHWKPRSVYCSLFSGDLLVGMYRNDKGTGKVIRFNQTGKPTQTIEHDNTGHNIYRKISYITENNNGVSLFLTLRKQ